MRFSNKPLTRVASAVLAVCFLGGCSWLRWSSDSTATLKKRPVIDGAVVITDPSSGLTFLVSNVKPTAKTARVIPPVAVEGAAVLPAARAPVVASAASAPVPLAAAPGLAVSTKLGADEVAPLPPIVSNDASPVIVSEAGIALKVDLELDSWTRVYFTFGSAELGPLSRGVLTRAAAANPAAAKIMIASFTDSSGNAAKNKVLATKRAASVRSFLVGLGVPAKSVRVRSGDAAPMPALSTDKLSLTASMPAPTNSHASLRRADVLFLGALPNSGVLGAE